MGLNSACRANRYLETFFNPKLGVTIASSAQPTHTRRKAPWALRSRIASAIRCVIVHGSEKRPLLDLFSHEEIQTGVLET
jgi:hypothetical protein